jgi:antitoxin ParD1/3/4
MGQVEKLSITLPASLARAVREKVESGEYASNSEVIREALEALQDQEMEQLLAGIDLRRALEEALDDPRPPVPAKEAFAGLRKQQEEMAKAQRRGK